MEEPLNNWLEKRKLTNAFESLPEDLDIHSLPLFPVVAVNEIDEGFIQWLMDKEPANKKEYTKLWLNSERLSADEIIRKGSIIEVESRRECLQVDNLPVLAKNEEAANRIKHELTANRINPCARFLDFPISSTGFQVTKS